MDKELFFIDGQKTNLKSWFLPDHIYRTFHLNLKTTKATNAFVKLDP